MVVNPNSSSFHTSSPILAQKDYYKILNIPRNASHKEIKKAYYELAKKYHPDTNKGDKETQQKFAEVAEAYEILSDDNKRRQYDTLGTTGFGGQQQGWPGGGFGGQHVDPEELFRKIFGDFTGRGQGGSGFQEFREYAPTEVTLDLKFTEAARGANKTISLKLMDTCPRCKGEGNEPGSKVSRCGYCGGSGMEQVVSGPFVMRSTCRKCGGTGKLITFPCGMCESKGQVMQTKTVTVPVPAGVENNQTVRMQVGTREVFITFRVAPSPIFRRQGADVHSDVKISISQAILGDSVCVPGIHSEINVKIPELTSSHHTFKYPGKGIKKINSYGFGDHFVHAKIEAPKTLTERQKELIREFAGEKNGGSKSIDYEEGSDERTKKRKKKTYQTRIQDETDPEDSNQTIREKDTEYKKSDSNSNLKGGGGSWWSRIKNFVFG
uniref:dnaJ homolog subfamily A member 3, mitochondrial-like isoform X1 n=1 Tax=Styela clava TaxID=7725 RepID=UPI0019399E60|nr:dnaJ homolog subfamily A member 3, mitochondrial-like isoform X1 [Styela clava]